MSGSIPAAQGVLNAFKEYLRAREQFAMSGGIIVNDTLDQTEGDLVHAEAQVHLKHNIAKMIHDDPKMALVRDHRITLAKDAARRHSEDDRIRKIVREVLAEVQK